MSGMLRTVILLCLPAVIIGSCQIAGHSLTRDDGSKYCKRIGTEVEMDVGDYYLRTGTCNNCTCSTWGLGCCGYGIDAGPVDVQPDCQIKMSDSCNYTIVKVDNMLEEC